MTQWDAIASDILREHATKVAVCCTALSMVFWLASQVKKHCCAQRQSVQAACGKGSRNRSSKHTLDAKVAWKIYPFELGHGSHRSKLVCQRKASRFTVCGKSLHLCLCMPSATCSSQCTTAQWVGQESTSGGQSSGESKAATRSTTK